jgi:hypothetical protein
MRTFGLQGLIVTLGERGAMHFGADGTVTANHGARAGADRRYGRRGRCLLRRVPVRPERKAGRWR